MFGSIRDLARAESGNHVQAIIVFSDGNSNLGSSEALFELHRRANNAARPINIYTVLVGKYRQPTEIRNIDIQTAETARPDDRFPLRIFVTASASLREEPFEVYLEATRKKDASGGRLEKEPPAGRLDKEDPAGKLDKGPPAGTGKVERLRRAEKYVFPVRKGTFRGAGDPPRDTIEYEINLVHVIVNREMEEQSDYKDAVLERMRTQLKAEPLPVLADGLGPDDLKAKFVEIFGIGQWEYNAIKLFLDHEKIEVTSLKLDDLKKKFLDIYGVGEWEFVARVPRHPRESFNEAWHKSDPPTRVLVQNRELRILLFAGGPTRDYQFVRDLFSREMQEKRVEMSVFLQTGPRGEGIDQGVPAERLLSHFPNKMGLDDPADKFSSLNMYDVIIAFDPDWSALDPEQLKNLKQWVGPGRRGHHLRGRAGFFV